MKPRFETGAIVGSLLGGAIGDVLGGVVERKRLSLSDDTQLTLATCEAILERGAVVPEVVAAAFLRTYRVRAIIGIGSSTLKALRDLDAGAHWALAGARGEMAAGNGAAMRIAPLAFVLDPHSTADRQVFRDVCRITHHSDEAYLGALAVALAIHSDLRHPDLFSQIARDLPDSRVRDRLIELASVQDAESLALAAARFGASGYVVETVPLALLVASRMVASDFSEVLHEATEIAGDTDTICAIAGQIAGSQLGVEGLPADLLNLEPVAQTRDLSQRFAAAVLDRRS